MVQEFLTKDIITLTVVVAAKYSQENIDCLCSWIPSAVRSGLQVRLAVDCRTSIQENSAFRSLMHQEIEVLEVGNFGGPGKARNSVMGNFRSHYVVFWDADDTPNISALSRLLNTYTGDKQRFIVGQWERKHSGTIKHRSHDLGLSSLAFSPGNWRILYPANSVEKKRFPEIWMGEDQVFLFRSGIFSTIPVWSEELLYSYNTGVNGQVTSQQAHIKDLRIAIRLIKESMKNFKKQEATYGYIMILRMLSTYLLRDRELTFPKKLIFVTEVAKKPRSYLRIVLATVICFKLSIFRKNVR